MPTIHSISDKIVYYLILYELHVNPRGGLGFFAHGHLMRLQGANTLSEASCRQMIDVMQAAKHGLPNDLPIVRFGDW
jgi:hypothetical protein